MTQSEAPKNLISRNSGRVIHLPGHTGDQPLCAPTGTSPWSDYRGTTQAATCKRCLKK